MNQVLSGNKIVIHLINVSPQVSSILIDHVRDDQLLEPPTKKELWETIEDARVWSKSRAGL